MKERPILFSAPMVRAILDGSKTQTRRVVKMETPKTVSLLDWSVDGVRVGPCPYGVVGDRLYVRETWQHQNHPYGLLERDCAIFYRADYFDDPHGMDGEKSPEGKYREWRPSIHMPRWASRITLEITGVRVERLNEISEADAQAEGCAIECMTPTGDDSGSSIYGPGGFKALWESISGAGSWDVNPWVWVVEFKRVSAEPT